MIYVFDIPTVIIQNFIKILNNNRNTLGRQELYYSYMGFKVGRFDKTKGGKYCES